MKESHKLPKIWRKFFAVVIILVAAFGMFAVLSKLRPEVVKEEPTPNYPKIEIFSVKSDSVRIQVDAQGTVRPRQQTRLTSRVSGHIDWVSQNFYEGGYFKKGDVLLRLDPLPYKSAVAETESRLALAESVLLQEQEAGEQARRDWEAVGAGEASQLVLRIPQLRKAKADLEAAQVALQMAKENLSYTEIRAPYDGRIQTKMVDVGQAITAQATVLGEIFSVEALEIPLAITLDDLELIDSGNGSKKPKVLLNGSINGTSHQWTAYLDRTAAMVDSRTRMISAYARMEPPFTSDTGATLTPGMFVSASIAGKVLDRAFRVPRSAIQPGNLIYRVKGEDQLESVELKIARTNSDWAIITSGLNDGDRICLTPLIIFTENMRIEIVDTALRKPTEKEDSQS